MRPISGNSKLIDSIQHVVEYDGSIVDSGYLNNLEIEIEKAVLEGKVIVISTALPPEVFYRAGVVPLRWGGSRIIVAAPNFMGRAVRNAIAVGDEPVRAWRLWRYKWDGNADLLALPALKRAKKVGA